MRVDREQSLDVALGQIERQFGKGSVMRMNDAAQVPTGAISTVVAPGTPAPGGGVFDFAGRPTIGGAGDIGSASRRAVPHARGGLTARPHDAEG